MNAPDPYSTPAAPVDSDAEQKGKFRTRELTNARIVLVLVGLVQLLLGGWHLSQVRSSFEEATRAEIAKMGPGFTVDEQKSNEAFEEQKPLLYVLGSLSAVFGIFLFVMATLVFRHPVGATSASLVVFALLSAADILADPDRTGPGVLLKVFFVVVLLKAWQSACTAKTAMVSGST